MLAKGRIEEEPMVDAPFSNDLLSQSKLFTSLGTSINDPETNFFSPIDKLQTLFDSQTNERTVVHFSFWPLLTNDL